MYRVKNQFSATYLWYHFNLVERRSLGTKNYIILGEALEQKWHHNIMTLIRSRGL